MAVRCAPLGRRLPPHFARSAPRRRSLGPRRSQARSESGAVAERASGRGDAGESGARTTVDSGSPAAPAAQPRLRQLVAPLVAQGGFVLCGWACSGVALLVLLKAVPGVGVLAELAGAGDVDEVRRVGGLLLALVAARVVAVVGQDALLWEASLRAASGLRARALRAVLLADGAQAQTLRGGDVAYRVTAEGERAADAAYALCQRLAPSLVQLVGVLWQMLALSAPLTAVVLVLAPAMALVVGQLGAGVQRRAAAAQTAAARAASAAAEALPAHALLAAYNASKGFAVRFEALCRRHAAMRAATERARAGAVGAITLVYAVTVIALLLVGASAVQAEALGAGELVTFVTFLALLIEPIQNVGSAFNELKQAQPALARLHALTVMQPTLCDGGDTVRAGGAAADAHAPALQLDDVHFDYALAAGGMAGADGGRRPGNAHDKAARAPALFSASLSVARGEVVALCGPSGGGKSTVAMLASRLADAQRGEVRLGGTDVRQMPLEEARGAVAVAPQAAQLFAGNMLYNVALGEDNNSADRRLARWALEAADAWDFVSAMGGLNVAVGERGCRLSGGQCARVGVARALYRAVRREATLLVLDEPTAALDGASQERLLKSALAACREQGIAVLMVAHREEATKAADRVIYIEAGQVKTRPLARVQTSEATTPTNATTTATTPTNATTTATTPAKIPELRTRRARPSGFRPSRPRTKSPGMK